MHTYIHTYMHTPIHTYIQTRMIAISDVAEVRPGKNSFSLSGSDDCRLTMVASTSCVTLPVPSVMLRDNLVKRFQAFVEVRHVYICMYMYVCMFDLVYADKKPYEGMYVCMYVCMLIFLYTNINT